MIKYKKAKTQENGPTGYLKKSNLQKGNNRNEKHNPLLLRVKSHIDLDI